MAVRVKICGITRLEDLRAACDAGADALGFVFYAGSPRHVSIERAGALVAALPPFVTSVGLFVDAEPIFVRQVLKEVPLDLLQFHGNESPDDCRGFGRPYLKAVRVRPGTDLLKYAADYRGALGLLLDAYVADVPGGTGERFDWRLIPAHFPKPVVLSGGLTPENVAEAVRRVKPWAVDVSSGVEAGPGIKDAAKVVAFIENARGAARAFKP
jgi:phosphoribosylanthranilate isomerase